MTKSITRIETLVLLSSTLALGVPLAQAQSVWNAVVNTSADTNWSTAANWTPNGVPGASSNVVFNNTATAPDGVTVNSVVDSLFGGTISSLSFTNTTSGSFENLLIGSGLALNVTGAGGLTVGNSTISPGSGVSTTVAISGPGARLSVSNTSANIYVAWGNSTAATGPANLIMSNLDTFTANVSRLQVGQAGVTRSSGAIYLAKTNTITAAGTGTTTSAAIVVGDNSANNGNASTLYLGLTNGIFANNIGCGLRKQNSASGIRFNPAFTNSNPTAYFRASDGVSPVSTWAMGDGSGASATDTETGISDFSGGTVNAVINTLIVARPASGASGGFTANGTFAMSAGTVTVGNLSNAVMVTSAHSETAIGNVVINGGTLSVTNNLVLGALNGFIGAPTGNLSITNGTVDANTITAGGGTSTINVIGGTLNVTNAAGTVTAPLSALSVSNSTLQLNIIGSTTPMIVATLTTEGTTDIVSVASMPGVDIFPTQLPLISYTTLSGTSDFGLGTLPGTYQGYISNNVAASRVDLVITGALIKSDTWNGNVSGNWDTQTMNWITSNAPSAFQQGDFVTFDDTLTGTTNVVVAAGVRPGAMGFNNTNRNYILSGTNGISGGTGLTKNGSGTVTLSESGGDSFAGGITVNSGTLILDNANSSINGGLTLNAGMVQIGNNDANGTLPAGTIVDNDRLVFDQTGASTVGAAITGTGSLTQNGSGRLTLTGANTYTNTTFVNNGTLALTGAGVVSSSAAVAVSGATFDVSGANQPALVNALSLANATISGAVSAGATVNIECSTLTFGGATNLLTITALPAIATYPVTFTIVHSATPAAGTFNAGLGAPLPGGSSGFVSQSADLTSILLIVTNGTVGVRPQVLWTGADLPNLNTNWSDRLNWQLPGAPTPVDNVLFNGTGSQTASELSTPGGGSAALALGFVNNVVDANFTISTLTFTNADGTFHNTWINDGLTLDVTNTLAVGSGTLDFGAATTESVAIAGTNATLKVNNTNGTLYVGLGSSSSGAHQATLDMSALGTFNASVSRFLVGVGSTAEGFAEGRECGVVYLAQTNNITASVAVSGTETSDTSGTAAALAVGDNDGNGGSASFLYLGQANAIFADAIVVGRQKQAATFAFNPNFTNSSVRIRGQNGISPVSIWSAGDGVANGGTTTTSGNVDLSGGAVDASVTTMYLGRAANSSGGSGNATGTLTLDGGVFRAGTIFAGMEPTNNPSKHGIGTINVVSNDISGTTGTLIVSGDLNMGFNEGGSGSTSSSGTLNMTNGTALVFGIVPGTNTPTTINLAGGALVLTNPVGSAAAPIGTLTLASLNIPGNSATELYLPVRTNRSGITATTFQIDGQATTTNIINVESVGPVGATPVELPLITYTTETLLSGIVTNIGLGTLPVGYAGYLTNDTANNMVALVLTSALHPEPVFTSLSLSGANLVAGGVNGFANAAYDVLESSDVTVPLSSWSVAATGVFGPTGSFSFTTPVTAGSPQQFFILRVH